MKVLSKIYSNIYFFYFYSMTFGSKVTKKNKNIGYFFA